MNGTVHGTCMRCGTKDCTTYEGGKCFACSHAAAYYETQPKPTKHPEQVPMAGGKASSSKGPPLHLIPTVALVGLAERFALGEERKGDKAWNAGSNNQECLLDKGWLIERCSHIIHHAMKMRDILVGKEQEETLYENAGAVAWAGAFFLCAADAIAKEEKKKPTFGEKIIEGLEAFEKDIKTASSTAEKRSLIHGDEYVCVNGMETGPVVYFKQIINTGKHVYYSENQSSVDWFDDGTPRRVNQSMSEEELEGYRIPKAQLRCTTKHEGNIGQ